MIVIATKDHTTAFVVAIPTPFAPPNAKYPQQELISDIAAPKNADFKIQTFMSFTYKPCQTELI